MTVPDQDAVDALASTLRDAYSHREGVDLFQLVAAGLIVLEKKTKAIVDPLTAKVDTTKAATDSLKTKVDAVVSDEATDDAKDVALDTQVKDLTTRMGKAEDRLLVLEKKAGVTP